MEGQVIGGVVILSMAASILASKLLLYDDLEVSDAKGCNHHFTDYSIESGNYRTIPGQKQTDDGKKSVFVVYERKKARCEHRGCLATDEKEVRVAVLDAPLSECLDEDSIIKR